MKLVSIALIISAVASQSFAGEPVIPRGRPSLPAETTVLKAEVKPFSGDIALFNNPNLVYVYVDLGANTVKVELYNDTCTAAAGMPTCLAMPDLLETYEAPIQSTTSGACGEVIYEAATRSYSVLVSDNRSFYNHCLSVRAVEPTTGSLRVDATPAAPAKEMTFEGGMLL